VLVSTHDLPKAGAVRAGFTRAGYDTELVTPSERLTADESVVLLVLTGMERGTIDELARQARDVLHVPVFGITAGAVSPSRQPGLDEVFGSGAAVDDIVVVGRRVIERRKLRAFTGIVGESDAIHQVLERVVQIAPVASTVLITGESGTGKELVARGIHALSPRRHEPFIAVNVAALSETLLESELFGHEKGAFTGAIDSRRGLFELADGGTIFLDEIGEMPLATQTKLLRVLEQREFHRVGGERSIKVDVRIIAATNQQLRQLVALGEFRRDLFFRLNVLAIELPPLRERREDIELLVDSFVREVSERHDRPFPGISPEAMRILIAYDWPGNVRELRNLVESMVVLAPNRVIRPEDIPEDVRRGRGSSLLPVPVTRATSEAKAPTLRPELEFVFRTLVELRVDMDDLRREFEAYRRGAPLQLEPATVVERRGDVGSFELDEEVGARIGPPTDRAIEIGAYRRGDDGSEHGGEADQVDDGNVVVFRAGMTMDDMERQAIRAALTEVGGNRRKAAELLGIGERTLYRKIAKYDLET
jgi:DNA-binding NtrC family response regulator